MMQTGQIFHVDILPRAGVRRDRKGACLAHRDSPDRGAPLGTCWDDGFRYVPCAESPYCAWPFAFRAWKTKGIAETHLTALASGRGDK